MSLVSKWTFNCFSWELRLIQPIVKDISFRAGFSPSGLGLSGLDDLWRLGVCLCPGPAYRFHASRVAWFSHAEGVYIQLRVENRICVVSHYCCSSSITAIEREQQRFHLQLPSQRRRLIFLPPTSLPASSSLLILNYARSLSRAA